MSVAISYYTFTNKAIVDAIDSLEWQAWYVQGKIYSVIQANESSITAFAESPTTIAFMKGEEVDMGNLKAQDIRTQMDIAIKLNEELSFFKDDLS